MAHRDRATKKKRTDRKPEPKRMNLYAFQKKPTSNERNISE